MAAAQQLPSSLRAALTYSLGLFALRRPFIHKILDYEDEFFALLMMVLETHSLRTTDASFSESLYGLRRRGVEIGLKKSNELADSGTEIRETGLRKHQKLLSVVFLVVLPYMKSKLQSVYDKDRQATLQASLWGDSDERFGDTDYLGRGNDLFGSRVNLDTETSARVRWTKFLRKTVGACYPWLHAGTEGLSFAYQLLYLLDATGFYSPGLHALGIHVCRATGQELMDTSSQISKIRSRERERLRGPPWLKLIGREPGFGIGAQITGICGLLAISINEKRVLITDCYNRADHDGCKGSSRSSWSCYFFPETSLECKRRAFELKQDKEAWENMVITGKDNYTSRDIWSGRIPRVWGNPWSMSQPTTEINGSLITHHRKMDRRWRRAQAVRYLMRLQSEYMCNLMNVARHHAFGWEAAKMVLASHVQICHFLK